MIHLALEVLAFLFLAWVGLMALLFAGAILKAIGKALDKLFAPTPNRPARSPFKHLHGLPWGDPSSYVKASTSEEPERVRRESGSELCAKCGTFHRYTGGRCPSLEPRQAPDEAHEAAKLKAQELGREIRSSLEAAEREARSAF